MFRNIGWKGALFAVLFGWCTSGAWAEEFELPERTSFFGFPPWVPFERPTVEDKRAWADEMIALGRAHAGTDGGGDALLSAAGFLDRLLFDPESALPIYREAYGAYPTGHPYAGPTLLRIAFVLEQRGDFESAADTLRTLDGWRMRPMPRAATSSVRATHERARGILEDEGRGVRWRVHEGLGRFADAAATAEEEARARQDATTWAHAGRLYTWAGKQQDALRAYDEAIALAPNDRERVRNRILRLYAEANLISKLGVKQPTEWPGDDWFRKALALLDELSSNRAGVNYAVQLGSQLTELDRHKEALQAYDRALRHPDIHSAKFNAGAFLHAVGAARKAGLYDEARDLLARIRLIYGNSELTDAIDVGVRSAEAYAKRKAEDQRQAEAAARARRAKERASSAAGTLADPRIAPEGDGRSGAPQKHRTTPETTAPLPFGGIGLGVLVLLGVVVLARRR